MRKIFLFVAFFLLLTAQVFAFDDSQYFKQTDKLIIEIKQLQNRIESYEFKIKRKEINKAKGLKFIDQLNQAISAKRALMNQLRLQQSASDQNDQEAANNYLGSALPAVPSPSPEATVAAIVDSIPGETLAPKEIARPRNISRMIVAGYTAGAIKIGLDFSLLFDNSRGILLGGAYGIGNKYNITMASLGFLFNLKDFYICPTLNYANYSATIKKIIGMPENVGEGSHVGGGLIFGRKYGVYSVQLGYNNTTGIMAEIGYKF